MIAGALLTIIAFIVLFYKFGQTFRELILGYDIVADVVVTVLFIIIFGSTGTISGMMIAIVAGLLCSVILMLGKKMGTSRTIRFKRESRFKVSYEWIIHHGVWYGLVRAARKRV